MTIWQTNHSEATGCTSDNVNIIYLQAPQWAWCMLTVVIDHDGGPSCSDEDWAVSTGYYTSIASMRTVPAGITPLAHAIRNVE